MRLGTGASARTRCKPWCFAENGGSLEGAGAIQTTPIGARKMSRMRDGSDKMSCGTGRDEGLPTAPSSTVARAIPSPTAYSGG